MCHGTTTLPSAGRTSQGGWRQAYFSQLICAADRSFLGDACLLIPPTSAAEPGQRPGFRGENGTPGRARTCAPRLRRPDVGIGYTKTVISESPSPSPRSSVQAKNRRLCLSFDLYPITDLWTRSSRLVDQAHAVNSCGRVACPCSGSTPGHPLRSNWTRLATSPKSPRRSITRMLSFPSALDGHGVRKSER